MKTNIFLDKNINNNIEIVNILKLIELSRFFIDFIIYLKRLIIINITKYDDSK